MSITAYSVENLTLPMFPSRPKADTSVFQTTTVIELIIYIFNSCSFPPYTALATFSYRLPIFLFL